MTERARLKPRPIVIGQSNPYTEREGFALYPVPKGAAGHRLFCMMRDVCPGFNQRRYLEHLERRNLLREDEGTRVATLRSANQRLVDALDGEGLLVSGESRLICLGQVVTRSLMPEAPPDLSPFEYQWTDVMTSTGNHYRVRAALMPHPSGRNYYYNDPVNRARAGVFLHDAIRALNPDAAT